MPDQSTQLLIVLAVMLAAPLMVLGLRLALPLVVLELLLGYVLGGDVLGLVEIGSDFARLKEAGMACLFLVVGVHVDIRTLRGATLRAASSAWGLSAVIALAVGAILALEGVTLAAIFIAIPLLTTSLGAVMSVMRENAWIDRAIVDRVMVGGTVAEIGPIVLIALVLGASSPLVETIALTLFATLILVLLKLARTQRVQRATRHVQAVHGSTTQGLHRLALTTLVLLLVVGQSLGLDIVLSAFATGIVYRQLLAGTDLEEQVLQELDVIAYAIFIPLYFVLSGAALEMAQLLGDWHDWARVPLFLAILVLVRVLPAVLAHRRAIGGRHAVAVGLLWSVTLPLVLASTELAVEEGLMLEVNAVALTAAAVLGMVIFPPIALRLLRAPHAAPDAVSPRDTLAGDVVPR